MKHAIRVADRVLKAGMIGATETAGFARSAQWEAAGLQLPLMRQDVAVADAAPWKVKAIT